MNHGFKINGNILEITIPDNIHIDKVIVNRQIFSQHMQVCKSCKYHEKEGHEEPCVSCEVGNSNYVPSVGLEEPTEERTETHACDCVSRQAAIDVAKQHWYKPDIAKALEELPSAEPDVSDINVGKWISCSEGLPEENDTYIVTCIDKNVNMKWTDVAEYSKRHSGWRYGLRPSDDIIAWQPLPEPYQEVDE